MVRSNNLRVAQSSARIQQVIDQRSFDAIARVRDDATRRLAQGYYDGADEVAFARLLKMLDKIDLVLVDNSVGEDEGLSGRLRDRYRAYKARRKRRWKAYKKRRKARKRKRKERRDRRKSGVSQSIQAVSAEDANANTLPAEIDPMAVSQPSSTPIVIGVGLVGLLGFGAVIALRLRKNKKKSTKGKKEKK